MRLRGIFRDGYNKYSATRMVLILGSLPFIVAVTAVFVFASIKAGEVAEIPASVSGFAGALLAHSALNKASENFGKNGRPKNAPESE